MSKTPVNVEDLGRFHWPHWSCNASVLGLHASTCRAILASREGASRAPAVAVRNKGADPFAPGPSLQEFPDRPDERIDRVRCILKSASDTDEVREKVDGRKDLYDP